jgi:predicted 2-oxoglutarate/Fe(II)-dependent dioxygenase YbiX
MTANRNQTGRYLQIGDRLPDFRRNDASGDIVMLYRDLHRGQPILILRDPAPAELIGVNRALTALAGAEEITVVVLVPGSVGDLTRFADMANVTTLADDSSLLEALRAGADKEPWAVLTDRNLRLLAILEGGADSREAELADAVARLGSPDSMQVAGPAPVLVVPRVLDSAFCDELIDEFETRGGQASGVFVYENGERRWRPDPNVKDRSDVYLYEGKLYERIQRVLVRRLLPEINRAFHFRVNRHEPFKLICYRSDTGGYFRPHRDNVSHDAWYRRFAMTINLNTGDYDGGELRFPEYGPHRYRPERGGAVVFSCSLVHEALPVTAGKRYALLTFFFDDEAEKAAIRAGGKPAPT